MKTQLEMFTARPAHASVSVKRRMGAVALSLAAAATLAAPALANPGNGRGQGNIKSGQEASATTLVASPETVQNGDTFTLSGCGYDDAHQINVTVQTPEALWFFPAFTDGNGCFETTRSTQGVGDYSIDAYQNLHGNKQSLMASTTLSVVP